MAQQTDFLTGSGNLVTGAIVAWDNQQGFQLELRVKTAFFTGMSGFRGRAINVTNGTTIMAQFMAYDGGDGNCYFYCRNATPSNYGDAHNVSKALLTGTDYVLVLRLDEVNDVWRTAIFEVGNTTAVHDVTRTGLYQVVPSQTGNYIELNVANAIGVEDFVWSVDLLAAFDHDHALSSADAAAKPDLADAHVVEVWAGDPTGGTMTGEQGVVNATVNGVATTDYDTSTGSWDYAAVTWNRNGVGLRVARPGSASRTVAVVRNAEFVHPAAVASGTRTIGAAGRNGLGIRAPRIGRASGRVVTMGRAARGIRAPRVGSGTSTTSGAGATVRNGLGLRAARMGSAGRSVAMSRNGTGLRVVRLGVQNAGAQSVSGFALFDRLTTYPAQTSTPGSAILIVYEDQPNRLELAGLKDADGQFLNGESLTVTFKDVDNADIAAAMSMVYTGASSGTYTVDTAASMAWEADRDYRAIIAGTRIDQVVRLRCKERGTV